MNSVFLPSSRIMHQWRRAISVYKNIRKRWMFNGPPVRTIWIFGCQRSGTTLLERMFRDDLDSEVFGEFSDLTISSEHTVLRPLKEVKKHLRACNAKYAVVRNLFESDRAADILDHFSADYGIWLFRHPVSVVDSMIRKWGDQFIEVSRRVESDASLHWRLEGLWDEIFGLAGGGDFSAIRISDAYALYWLKRNQMVFSNGLNESPRVFFVRYETLIKNPKRCIGQVVRSSLGKDVWKHFSTDANEESLETRLDSEISEPILVECLKMYELLSELENLNVNRPEEVAC